LFAKLSVPWDSLTPLELQIAHTLLIYWQTASDCKAVFFKGRRMENLNLSDDERSQHLGTIETLCEKFPRHVDLIKSKYLEILEKMSQDAEIRTYLPILIAREIQTLIRIREIASGH
jgi:hypothetical protein